METLVTNTEKQTTQSGMDEARDRTEGLAQLEKETTRKQTTLKLKERSQTRKEPTTLGKPNMTTRETRDWNEWSLIFEAYNAAGSTQLAQILKRTKDGGAAPFLAHLNGRDKVSKANHQIMLAKMPRGRAFSSGAAFADPRNDLANWQKTGG